MQHDDGVINTESSLKAFFHDSLWRESEKNQLPITEHTHWYLTNLLHNYSRSEDFFDYRGDRGTFTPLADYYRRALEAPSPHERRLHLQRLGDVAMFIAGMFSEALSQRVVGLSYYVAMGETAYGTLAETAATNNREQTQAAIFSDLSIRFTHFVDLLKAIGPAAEKPEIENAAFETLLQKVDEWQRTGNPELGSELRGCGILLDFTSTTTPNPTH